MNGPPPSSGRRLLWLDQAKGYGITLVVLGHTYKHGISDWIYLFHMPLFFMIAGTVCRPGRLAPFVARRIASLLLPYASFLILLLLADDILALIGGASPGSLFHAELARAGRYLYGGRALVDDLGTLWFLPCLFLALVAYAAIRSFRPNIGSAAILCGVVLPGYALSLWLGAADTPLNLAVAPAALAFVAAGNLWMERFADHGAPRTITATAAIVAAASLLLWRPMDMKMGDLGTPLWTAVAALAWSHLTLLAFRTYGERIPGAAWIAWLGRASLVILTLQRFVIDHAPRGTPSILIAAAAVLLPAMAYEMLLRSGPICRLLFLGQRLKRTPVTPLTRDRLDAALS